MARARRRRNGSSSSTIRKRFVFGTLAGGRSATVVACIFIVLLAPALPSRQRNLPQNPVRSQSQRRARPENGHRGTFQRPVQTVHKGDFSPGPLQQSLGNEYTEAKMLMLLVAQRQIWLPQPADQAWREAGTVI